MYTVHRKKPTQTQGPTYTKGFQKIYIHVGINNVYYMKVTSKEVTSESLERKTSFVYI